MNRVVHFEIHANDPERAVTFYRTVFGWEMNRWGDEEYWLINSGDDSEPGINGGVLRRRGDAPTPDAPVMGFVCTIHVPSIDRAISAVIDNGGKIVVEKNLMPHVGWLAYAKDTEGNVFGMIQDEHPED